VLGRDSAGLELRSEAEVALSIARERLDNYLELASRAEGE
jgi:hypothetical protein